MVNYFGFLLPKKLKNIVMFSVFVLEDGDLYIFRVCFKFFVLIGSYVDHTILITQSRLSKVLEI